MLYTLAESNKQHAKLQEDASRLLGRGGIPQEAAEEVFKQALGVKRKSTAISEELYDNCANETEFHLVMCLGVRVLDEARAWRLRKKLKPTKGEFKDLNPRSFKDLSIQFGLAPTTVNRNYNEAVTYHKLRKHKRAKKTDPGGDDDEGEETSDTSLEVSDEESMVQEEPMVGTEEEEVLKIAQELKQKPVEKRLFPVGE